MITYEIVASNAGPSDAPAALVIDIFPDECESPTWTCAGTGCAAPVGSGHIFQAVDLPVGGSVTFSADCTVSLGATGVLSNTATIGSLAIDPNPANNSATDLDSVILSSQ